MEKGGSAFRLDAPDRVRGYIHGRSYVEHTLHFAAAFSSPVTSTRVVRESDGVRGETVALDFGPLPNGVLEIRLALSTTSEAAAAGNLASEIPAFAFDAVRAAASEALGHREDAAFFRRRSEAWRNVFDASTGFMRGKDSQGRWRTPFDPYKLGSGPWQDNDFTEGNTWQYSWHVMQDPRGLVAALGGEKAAGEKLDRLFAAEEKTDGDSFTHDVSGLVGQYAHGNEPSHHVAYFYAFTDRPHRTAEIVRKVFDTQYRTGPLGLCGNEDCGQMSAWYVFSALGFYPFDPCGGDYVLGAPQLPGATLRLAGGRTLRIVAQNFAREHPHVKTVTLNGQPLTGRILRHADLLKGGELVFDMQP